MLSSIMKRHLETERKFLRITTLDRARGSTKRLRGSVRTPASETTLHIKGREIPVSRLGKVFYPRTGFTKGEVLDYYLRVSPVLLPHLKGRPITLKRYPDGVAGGFFYEKRCPSYRPRWVQTAAVWSERHEAQIHYCLGNDLATIVWAVNLGDLELHTFLAKAANIQRPTAMVFDLDPGAPANILHCVQAGLWLKEKLDELKLEGFAKTSGSKGLQVYVPLNTPTTYSATKPFARRLAEQLEREHPDLVISKMDRRLRAGKVLVDWSQNDYHKTTVCVYSLRAKDQPRVSTPVEWGEAKAALERKDAGALAFPPEEVLERVARGGDLFQAVLKLKQKLPAL